MKVNSININFGKKLVATCYVKDKQRVKHPALIFQYNPRDIEDMKEIQFSPNTNSIKRDFFKEGYFRRNMPESGYYGIQDISTGDIIACAKTTQHYALNGKYKGLYTSIDELEGNDEYINTMTPMMGLIANKAQEAYSRNILTAIRTDEAPSLGESKFHKIKEGVWAMRSRAYKECISRAEKRSNLEIIG